MKDRTILAIKGLAIIGVVFHHVVNRRLAPEAVDGIGVFVFLFNWCVLAFFCVSGYLQALSDAKKQRGLAEFARVRFQRLIVPFLLLALLYSTLWQIILTFHIPNIGVKVPPTFIGKLEDALWPIDSQEAQQIYFFPLLFAISLVHVLVRARLGLKGIWVLAWTTSVVGVAFFPHAFTGFSWGTFLWGISFYAAGYLLFHYRANQAGISVVLIAFTAVLVIFTGLDSLFRCVPLWLLSEGPAIKLDRVPLLARLGDASGTIYIYHTPFIIMPLVIAATYLPGPAAQFIGILLALAIAIAICTAIFELLKDTRAKVLLM